jgi:tetratricopeptide (TPR) repeat protein
MGVKMSANMVFFTGVVLFLLGSGLTYLGSHLKSKEDTKSLKILISEKYIENENQKIQLENLQKGNTELINGKNELLTLNQELSDKIEKYQEDLKEKEILIKELEKKSKKTERGISSMYDFDGSKRETTKPGHINLNIGPEVEIFQRINELEKQKKYSEIIRICENQINKTPEWLTPYLFLGVAFANTGNKTRAVELFNYVIKNAPDDPAYKQAREFLEKLSK